MIDTALSCNAIFVCFCGNAYRDASARVWFVELVALRSMRYPLGRSIEIEDSSSRYAPQKTLVSNGWLRV
jgi:hypothetical protein